MQKVVGCFVVVTTVALSLSLVGCGYDPKHMYSDTAVAKELFMGDKVTFTADGVSFNMTYITGSFTFPTGVNDESTATVSHLYFIADTVVTYELWYKVYSWAIANGYTFADAGAEGSMGKIGAEPTANKNHPVTRVSWRDAMIFSNAATEWYNAATGSDYTCAYYLDADYNTPIRSVDDSDVISEKTGTPNGTQDGPYVRPDATGFRMLLNNEYELAARYKGLDADEIPVWTSGNYASGAADYSFDNKKHKANINYSPVSVAWFNANSKSTHEVALLQPNALGLYDMNGNVQEWVFDWEKTLVGSYRTICSGAWWDNIGAMQVGWLGIAAPKYALNGQGFRLAMSVFP